MESNYKKLRSVPIKHQNKLENIKQILKFCLGKPFIGPILYIYTRALSFTAELRALSVLIQVLN